MTTNRIQMTIHNNFLTTILTTLPFILSFAQTNALPQQHPQPQLPTPTATASPTPIPATQEEISASWSILILISILITILLTSYVLQQSRIRFIHETVVSIVLGCIAGALIRYLPITDNIQRMVTFDHKYFFNLLLPPIILNSGYDMKRRLFFKNFGSILIFAFIGTFVSTIVIGVMLYLVAGTGIFSLSIPLLDCFVFGAILSSTDPVTILSMFQQLKVEPKLYAIIFGESILNDSVAIVLFGTLGQFQGQPLTIQSILQGIHTFLGVFFGSVIIGVTIALICALMLKHTHLHLYPSLESCLISLIAYTSYLLSNAIQLSGIVSLLFCGITLKHYAYDNMSTITRHTTKRMFRVLSQMTENFVFIYLGVSLFTMTDQVIYVWLILYTCVIVMLARYVSVIPLSNAINFVTEKWDMARQSRSSSQSHIMSSLFNNRDTSGAPDHGTESSPDSSPTLQSLHVPRIPHNHQLMLWWSGLRGAIAFALAFDVSSTSGPIIRTTTLIVCVISVVVLGGTTHIAIDRLGIRTGVGSHRHRSQHTMMDKRRSDPILIDTDTMSSQPHTTHRDSIDTNYDDDDDTDETSSTSSEYNDHHDVFDRLDFHETLETDRRTDRAPRAVSAGGVPIHSYPTSTRQFGRSNHQHGTGRDTRHGSHSALSQRRRGSDNEHWFLSFDEKYLKPLFTQPGWSRRHSSPLRHIQSAGSRYNDMGRGRGGHPDTDALLG